MRHPSLRPIERQPRDEPLVTKWTAGSNAPGPKAPVKLGRYLALKRQLTRFWRQT
jgi:hypothetical protein